MRESILATKDPIIIQAAIRGIVAIAAIERVMSRSPIKTIVFGATIDTVRPGFTMHFIGSTLVREQVRAGPRMFERLAEDSLVLWWLPAGQIPTVEDGMTRLERLRSRGPTPEAFTFRARFPPPHRSP